MLEKEVSVEESNNKSSMSPLHFNYCITTAGLFSQSPVWKPVRIFDDDIHTYIQFPDTISHRDLPALFVIQNGQKVCANYRFRSPYLIVDQLFEEARLVSGVGSSQQAVIMIRKEM